MEDEKEAAAATKKTIDWAEFLVILSNIHKCIKIKQTTWNNQQITNYGSFSVDGTFTKKKTFQSHNSNQIIVP